MGLNSHIIDFSKLDGAELDLVGKKAYQLSKLKYLDIPIPDGFVITTSFFKEFLEQTGFGEKIKEIQNLNQPAISDSIAKLLNSIQKQIIHTPIPQNHAIELHRFYRKLAGLFKEPSLNIFSSSSNYKSVEFLNVKGDANLILKIKTIWTSCLDKPVAIVVQKNIKSKIKGTITTSNPIKELEHLAKKIQRHFYFPQELDYAIEKGKIYITQVKPFTGKVERSSEEISPNRKIQKVLIKGTSINPGIVTGPAKILHKNQNNFQIKAGEIIVVSNLNPKLYGRIKKAKAIVINDILPKAHDRMIYRKYIEAPIIEGAKNATELLQNGNIITVNGATGEIYSGGLIY